MLLSLLIMQPGLRVVEHCPWPTALRSAKTWTINTVRGRTSFRIGKARRPAEIVVIRALSSLARVRVSGPLKLFQVLGSLEGYNGLLTSQKYSEQLLMIASDAPRLREVSYAWGTTYLITCTFVRRQHEQTPRVESVTVCGNRRAKRQLVSSEAANNLDFSLRGRVPVRKMSNG
jgi:hypothetical protein